MLCPVRGRHISPFKNAREAQEKDFMLSTRSPLFKPAFHSIVTSVLGGGGGVCVEVFHAKTNLEMHRLQLNSSLYCRTSQSLWEAIVRLRHRVHVNSPTYFTFRTVCSGTSWNIRLKIHHPSSQGSLVILKGNTRTLFHRNISFL